jgi:hypothetical protein
MTVSRYHHTASVLLDRNVLICGGSVGKVPEKSNELYDVSKKNLENNRTYE